MRTPLRVSVLILVALVTLFVTVPFLFADAPLAAQQKHYQYADPDFAASVTSDDIVFTDGVVFEAQFITVDASACAVNIHVNFKGATATTDHFMIPAGKSHTWTGSAAQVSRIDIRTASSTCAVNVGAWK